jgi:hypothetical protein
MTEPGDPFTAPTASVAENDISMKLSVAMYDPKTQVGNVIRGLVEQQSDEGGKFLKVGKVQNPFEIAPDGMHECPNSKTGPISDRYLCPETVYENPDEPHLVHTIADVMTFEDDKPKGKWKKATLVEQAGFVQALHPEAIRGQGSKRPQVSPVGRVISPEPVPAEVQKLTEEIQAEMPKAPPKKARTEPRATKYHKQASAKGFHRTIRAPSSAQVGSCATKTRTLAQRLREYDKAKTEVQLTELRAKLAETKRIEQTTESNEELDTAQEEISRLQREVKHLEKLSIDTFRKEFQELKGKCPGLSAEYHDKLGQYSNVLKLHYTSDGLNVQSLVVREDAKELLDEILRGGI